MFFDANDPDLKQKIDALPATPGFCVFLDIVGSTALKDQSLHRWAALIHNTFANIAAFPPLDGMPLKCLGDALMFYIPERILASKRENALTLFAGIVHVLQDRNPLFREIKAAAVRGTAYELSFVRGQPDFYSKDIDLCARLLSISKARRVVMNDSLVEAINSDYDATGNKSQFSEVTQIRPICSWRPRGFSREVKRYVYQA